MDNCIIDYTQYPLYKRVNFSFLSTKKELIFFFSHINNQSIFHFTPLFSVAGTKGNKHKEHIQPKKKTNIGGQTRPPTGDDRRQPKYATGIGVCKKLVILLKSKIFKYL